MMKTYCNWTFFLLFLVLMAPALLVDWVVLVLYLPVLALAGWVMRWVHTPLGLFTKTEYANGVATVTNILKKKRQTIELNNAAHLYKLQIVYKYLVVSEEPLAGKAEAVSAYKAGKAGFVIYNVDCDALYSYMQKASWLK